MKNVKINGQVSAVYFVNSLGEVFSKQQDGTLLKLKQWITNAGYNRVHLSRDMERKMYTVHRIVAETFIDNPENLPIVNHKDYNKLNNCVDNLEWCTYSQNNKHTCARMTTHHSFKRVAQLDLVTGEVIKEWEGLSLACRELGLYSSNINKVCRGVRSHAGGFGWKYL